MTVPELIPGAVVCIRSVNWKVLTTAQNKGFNLVTCRGLTGITKNKEAQYVWELEDNPEKLDPAQVNLKPDDSPGYVDTKLHLGAAFLTTPNTSKTPMMLGRAAIDDLKYQHVPVEMALNQNRVRLLIADDVGLGKTLEAGLITSELAIRGRADRVLVITTRAMLTQFQKEFWTRFSIPLARLDSAAIQRMRNKIPAHYNVFDQFDRSIVSIDTLKKNREYRKAIEESYWDLIIIDEAHNAANRARSQRKSALRATLAKLLSSRADSLLLLTATPHDGSHESFASLIEMLDQTRVPDRSNLNRKDINDLVIRRFRNTPEVQNELNTKLKKRQLHKRIVPLSYKEEEAYNALAELQLDSDNKKTGARAIDLFRITLTKSLFSSPQACEKSIERRIKKKYKDSEENSFGEKESDSKPDFIDESEINSSTVASEDKKRLHELSEKVQSIDKENFSKYQDLLELLKELGWDGTKKKDRIVIFSERIDTIDWLENELKKDLGLDDNQIARIDGGSVEADKKTQKILEQFGQEKSPIRILIASDMASEGINLHHQCFRLIHFDLPWSLLRFQQRNGRIDRYDQTEPPQIYYFVGESIHEKVRQLWVLDKLIEKDEAVQTGLGDPSVFLGVGDAEEEEKAVAEVIASGIGSEKFEEQMDQRAQESNAVKSLDDEYDALFGEFPGEEAGENYTESGATTLTSNNPPRLYSDVFDFTANMLIRLNSLDQQIFDEMPAISQENRLIRLKIPKDMCASDSLGYSKEGKVDEKYMPVEAVGKGGVIELTDKPQVITQAIAVARTEEQTWPSVQFLWQGHPILHWFADQAESLFPNNEVPFVKLQTGLKPKQTAVLIHGSIYNVHGTPISDRWAVVMVNRKSDVEIDIEIMEVNDFIEQTGFSGNTPNLQSEPSSDTIDKVAKAVDFFQTHLVELHNLKKSEIDKELDGILTRLADLEQRYCAQLNFKFSDVEDVSIDDATGLTKHRLEQRLSKEKEIEKMFKDYEDWYNNTRRTVHDPNPFVHVKAVFEG